MVALEHMYNTIRRGTAQVPTDYTKPLNKEGTPEKLEALSSLDMLSTGSTEMGSSCAKLASSRHTKLSSRQKHRSIKKCRKMRTDKFCCLLDDDYASQTECLLSKISNWSFDVFALDKATDGRALFHVILELFKHHDLIEKFQLDPVKLMTFATLVEEGYHSNPYHNAIHAADVTQAMHCYISQTKISKYMTPVEKLVSLLSAITHDLDHPGVNQGFLIATSNHLATLYDNQAVLEKHHCRSAVGALHQTQLLDHLSVTLRAQIEEDMKSLILATDMTRQQEFFSTLKERVSNDTLDMGRYEDRHFILQIALKCADISNPCRHWSVCKSWSDRVCEEFFRQGDLEKELNLPVSPLCDRSTNTVPKIQTGFINFVVKPLFEEFERYLFPCSTLSEQLKNLSYNLKKWQDFAARPSSINLALTSTVPPATDIPSPTPSINDDCEDEEEDQVAQCQCPTKLRKIIERRLSLPVLSLFRKTQALVRRQSFPNGHKVNPDSKQELAEKVRQLEDLAGQLLPITSVENDNNNNNIHTLAALTQLLSQTSCHICNQRPTTTKFDVPSSILSVTSI